jgi:hypothetical protein
LCDVMIKKILISVFIFIIVGYVSLVGIFLSNVKVTDLVLCSLNDNVVYLPESLCSAYLIKMRSKPEDIAQLKNNGGVKFILSASPNVSLSAKSNSEAEEKNKETRILVDHFLAKGLDINQISKIDGLTALHGEILLNRPEWVEFLIKRGASLKQKDNRFNLTPLEFAQMLQKKNPTTDRSTVISILSKGNST